MAAKTDGKPSMDFYVGVSLAISSSLFIGASFVITKKGLQRATANKATRAGQGGLGYLKDYIWWLGFLSMLTGELCNFSAYAFAPATVVTPLGALSVIVSALLSSRYLNESLNLHGVIGCVLCILGSTQLLTNAPRSDDVDSLDDLRDKLFDIGFVSYTLVMMMIAVFMMVVVAPRHGTRNMLVYVTICACFGCITVMSCKGLGIAVKEWLSGKSVLMSWTVWLLIISLIMGISIQLNYLNRALDMFNTALVTPVYYVLFTSVVITASAILYKEWRHLSAVQTTNTVGGFLTIIIGIFLLQAFKDIQDGNILLQLYNRASSNATCSSPANTKCDAFSA